MISIDDCGRADLRRFSPYVTPRQLAEAKHRIAEYEAQQAKARADLVSEEAVAAARAARHWFEAHGADDHYALLFSHARVRAAASTAAFRAYQRLRLRADQARRAMDYRPTERAP